MKATHDRIHNRTNQQEHPFRAATEFCQGGGQSRIPGTFYIRWVLAVSARPIGLYK